MRTPTYGLSDQDFKELDGWLMRRRTGITDMVELEGFLTAIIIGPTTLMPMAWLPKVWGGKQPRFKSPEEMNRFMALVMGYYNDIVMWFEHQPERFQPTFYQSMFEGKRVIVVDEWCVGFLKGIRLDAAAWKPLKKQRPELLKPIELFGSPRGWKEISAGDGVAIHKKWSPKIAPSVRAIHQYWVPYREARYAAETNAVKH